MARTVRRLFSTERRLSYRPSVLHGSRDVCTKQIKIINYFAILSRQLSMRKEFLRVRRQDAVTVEQVLYNQPQAVWEGYIIIIE